MFRRLAQRRQNQRLVYASREAEEPVDLNLDRMSMSRWRSMDRPTAVAKITSSRGRFVRKMPHLLLQANLSQTLRTST